MEHPESQNQTFPPVQPGYPTGAKEMAFAVSSLVSGLLLMNFILFGGFSLGFAIAATLCIVGSSVYLLASGCKLSFYSGALLILSLVISVGFARSDDGFVKFVMVCFLLLSVNLGLCLLAGQNLRSAGTFSSWMDAPRAFFIMGIGGLGDAFRGLKTAFRRSGTIGQKTGAIAVGLLICVPVLLILVGLLMSADAAFEGLMDHLPEWDLYEIFYTAFMGSGLACILYSRGASLRHSKKTEPHSTPRKGINALTVNTVLIGVCLVYVVYLVSQLAYFVGGFSGILPQGYTMAEYARRGFFEMAWLCAINLGIIGMSMALARQDGKVPVLTKILCLFIGIVAIFFVATASGKMFLYIGSYGLTRLRVLTQVIMLWMALAAALICVWLFVPKMQYMKSMVISALIIGAVVFWADVDSVVAKYNVEAYLKGDLQTVDVAHLDSLGDSAVPYIDYLAENAADPLVAQMASDVLKTRYYQPADDFRGWNYVNQQVGDYLTPLPEEREPF